MISRINNLSIESFEKFPESKKDLLVKVSKLSYNQMNSMYRSIRQENITDYNFKSIKNYCKDTIKNNLIHETTYTYPRGQSSGRMWGSTTGLFREIRGLLFDDVGLDIDMVNCHPTLLLYLCNKYNIETQELDMYIKKRDKCLNQIMELADCNRVDAKNLILKSINYEKKISVKSRKKKDNFVLNIDNEIKKIQNKLKDILPEKYNEVYKINSKKGRRDNFLGAFVSHLLTELESEILKKVLIAILEKYPHTWFALFYDGFIIDKEIDLEDILKICNDITKNEYGIKWANKPFDLSLHEEIENIDRKKDYHAVEFDDYRDLSKYFVENIMTKDILFKSFQTDSLEIIPYVRMGYQYVTNKDTINSQIERRIIDNDLSIVRVNEKGKPSIVNVSSSKASVVDEARRTITKCIPQVNNFNVKLFDKSVGKILYQNGEYNFITGHFETDPKKIYSKNIANIEFNPKSNPEIRELLMKNVFYKMFGVYKYNDLDKQINKDKKRARVMRVFLHKLAKSIAGMYLDKKAYAVEGEPNSSKGTIIDLLINTFGQGYVKICDSNNFTKKNSDGAKSFSWYQDFEFARIAYTNETQEVDGKIPKMDGNILKNTFASGGDYKETRKNFKDEVNVRSQATHWHFYNQQPDWSPSDVWNRIEHFELLSVFCDKKDMNELSNINYYPKDDNIKNVFVKREDVCNEFAHILHEAFHWNVKMPKSLLKDRKLLILEENDDKTKFLNLFSFTKDINDYVTSKTIKQLCKENAINYKTNKCFKYLQGKGGIRPSDDNMLPVKKNNSLPIYGVKLKSSEILSDESDSD